MDTQWVEDLAQLMRDRKGLPLPSVDVGNIKVPGGNTVVGKVIHAPKVLSLGSEYRNDFLGFLYTYRWEVFVAPSLEKKVKHTNLIELKSVQSLDLDGALVLVAEYARNCKNNNYRPLINDEEWVPEVRNLLEQLGFYEFVQATERSGHPAVPESAGRQFVRFASGSEVKGAQATALIETLELAAGSTPKRQAIYAGLVEAMMNVINHAYRDRRPTVYPALENWWIAGSFDAATQELEFIVYDQGIGIPASIPGDQHYFDFIARLLKGAEDADMIEAAIELGRTSTDMPERGNGLWTICQVAEELDGSMVRILSGRGEVTYSSRGEVRKKAFSNPFCGTLVQWTLKLPADNPSEIGLAA